MTPERQKQFDDLLYAVSGVLAGEKDRDARIDEESAAAAAHADATQATNDAQVTLQNRIADLEAAEAALKAGPPAPAPVTPDQPTV